MKKNGALTLTHSVPRTSHFVLGPENDRNKLKIKTFPVSGKNEYLHRNLHTTFNYDYVQTPPKSSRSSIFFLRIMVLFR